MKLAVCLVALMVLGGPVFMKNASNTAAAKVPNSAFIYRSGGYVLTLRVPHPTWRTPWATYPVGDDTVSWGSTPVDYIRFYGHPYGFAPNVTELLGMAEMWNTCNPNCAQALTRALIPLYAHQCEFVIGTNKSTGCLHPIGFGRRALGEPVHASGGIPGVGDKRRIVLTLTHCGIYRC
jgi:hypothetical protein